MRPVVFDLDQTLIRGGALDWMLWLAAISRAVGTPIGPDEDWAALPNHTDHGLLESLSQRHRGRSFTEEERVVYEDSFLLTLDEALAVQPDAFEPIPGAAALLDALKGRAALATGNIHASTVRKLRSSGLARDWMPCSCSEGARDRTHLVARALEATGWRPGQPATSFGDAVWDVRAAAALGVGFIGVASSDAHELRLRNAGAKVVIREYLDLDGVLEAIEVA